MKKQITKKQKTVLDDLFKGDLSEVEVLKKHTISTAVYRKWLVDEAFAEELAFRIQAGKRQCSLIITNYAPIAAMKLVALTECQKEETIRKACLDIISLPLGPAGKKRKKGEVSKDEDKDISADLASKILGALADEANLK